MGLKGRKSFQAILYFTIYAGIYLIDVCIRIHEIIVEEVIWRWIGTVSRWQMADGDLITAAQHCHNLKFRA
jgi:hypothetical protein